MPNDLLLNALLIVILVGAYSLWRKNQAIKSREILADKVDVFLAGDADEVIKEFVYKFYEASIFPLFSVLALISVIRKTVQKTPKTKKRKKNLRNALEKASKDNNNMMKGILSQGVKVILNRAPITTLICMIILAIFIIFQVLLDKMPFNKIIGDPGDVLDDTIKHCN